MHRFCNGECLRRTEAILSPPVALRHPASAELTVQEFRKRIAPLVFICITTSFRVSRLVFGRDRILRVPFRGLCIRSRVARRRARHIRVVGVEKSLDLLFLIFELQVEGWEQLAQLVVDGGGAFGGGGGARLIRSSKGHSQSRGGSRGPSRSWGFGGGGEGGGGSGAASGG